MIWILGSMVRAQGSHGNLRNVLGSFQSSCSIYSGMAVDVTAFVVKP